MPGSSPAPGPGPGDPAEKAEDPPALPAATQGIEHVLEGGDGAALGAARPPA